MKCTKCGVEILDGNKFCTNCGSSINTISMNVLNQSQNTVYQNNTLTNSNQTNSSVEHNKKAKSLCIISLLCYFVVPFVLSIIFAVLSFMAEAFASFVSMFAYFTYFVARIVAYVLMIVVRIKYPKSTFGKVIMWIYIGLFALGIIFTVLIVIFIIFMVFNYW